MQQENDQSKNSKRSKKYIVAKFKIEGNLRYLSHQQSLRLFQRAFVRSDIQLSYSQGFNPRPLLSLPLPRPVSVESDDELLYAGTAFSARPEVSTMTAEQLKDRLCQQLPDGCKILSLELIDGVVSYHPISAVYIFPIRENVFNRSLETRVNQLLSDCSAGRSIPVERYAGRGGKKRVFDIAGLIETIELNEQELRVKYKITPAGAVRMDEIMQLLQMEYSMLAGAVKRTNVQWAN